MIFGIIIVAAYITWTSLTLLEMKRQHDDEVFWLREVIKELEADKRTLTESLCRSEGKVFVPSVHNAPRIPSEGWFDAETKVTIVDPHHA